jgi:hypothetical protein
MGKEYLTLGMWSIYDDSIRRLVSFQAMYFPPFVFLFFQIK